MDNSKKKRKIARRARVFRVRKKLHGTASCPRLSVLKTNVHISAQLIDDDARVTLAGFSTQSKDASVKRKSKQGAIAVGQAIARLAKEKKIDTVIFDRGRYKFHGLIAELANSAREAGLQF